MFRKPAPKTSSESQLHRSYRPDYDFWLAADDIERFNAVVARFDLQPTCVPDEARRRGRCEDLWMTRAQVQLGDVPVSLPSLDGLILTKPFRSRPKDLEDIRLLRVLKERQASVCRIAVAAPTSDRGR